MNHINTQQNIILNGCFNFRDLGGYRTYDGKTTRFNKIFRSDELHNLTTRDISHLTAVLDIKAIIDLRNPSEIRKFQMENLRAHGISYFKIPLVGDETWQNTPPNLIESYLSILQNRTSAHQIGKVVEIIAKNIHHSSLFFCVAGKDRTGIVAAVVLGLLNVTNRDIVSDYALSRGPWKSLKEKILSDPFRAQLISTLPKDFLVVRESFMTETLRILSKTHGSIHQYARSLVTNSTFLRIREALVL